MAYKRNFVIHRQSGSLFGWLKRGGGGGGGGGVLLSCMRLLPVTSRCLIGKWGCCGYIFGLKIYNNMQYWFSCILANPPLIFLYDFYRDANDQVFVYGLFRGAKVMRIEKDRPNNGIVNYNNRFYRFPHS